MKKIGLCVIAIFLLLITFPANVKAQLHNYNSIYTQVSNDEQENIDVYKIASSAVVTIKTGSTAGAGCIIDPSGIVVTNKHVIGNGYNVNVKLADGNMYNASVIDVDNDDLALLKINSNTSFPYIRLGDSSKVQVGQRVLAIGNPFGLERTLTIGIISRIDYNMNRIQTDAAINPGNSGGPLLNSRGELIAINQAILNPSGKSSAGIGFSIPSNTVKRLLAMSKNARIISGPVRPSSSPVAAPGSQFPRPAYQNKTLLGIAGRDMPNGSVVVAGVAQGSPAAMAGLKFNDVVLAVDSVKVKSFNDIGFALMNKKPGDKVNLLYMRNGMVNSSTAVLTKRN